MIVNKKEFTIGLSMMVLFSVVLAGMFLPMFNGKNFLNYMDSLYNSISKSSADYIPKLSEDCKGYMGKRISLSLALGSEKQAEQTALLFSRGGASVNVTGAQLTVHGDLGRILANCLSDSADMFANQGERVREKYGLPERLVLYNWWKALKIMEKQLNEQKRFGDAKFVASVKKRGVECSYNFYRIVPEKISAKAGIVVFSLAFYVIYTVWYGFAFLYLFQGVGLRLEH
jgi:hypothetical protein